MLRLAPAGGAPVDLAAAYAVHAERHVRANFVSSADGAATVDGRSGALGNESDRDLFQLLRRMSDVVLVGAGTARAEGYGGVRPHDGTAPPPIAVVTRSCTLDPSARLFTDTTVPPIVVTCAAAPPERRQALEPLATVLVTGDDDVDLAAALDRLAERGLRHVLCEGGPQLFGALAQADLLDELCLTLSPVLAGGDAGRIVAGYRPRQARTMHLHHVLADGDYLYLRYSTGAS